MPYPLPENRLFLVRGNTSLTRHKQRESVRKIPVKQSYNKVVSDNAIKTPPVLDRGHFEIEKKHYDNHMSLTSYSNSLLSNTVNQNDVQQIEFTIDSRINIWNQKQTASCSAHAACFLYTYIMVFKGVDFTEFAQCSSDLQCISNAFLNGQAFNSTLRPLTLKTGYDMWLNPGNDWFRVGYDDIDSYFSRLFGMWSAYYTPLGSYDYNIQITSSPPPPAVLEGTAIISALVGLQTWGCVPLLGGPPDIEPINNVGFTFKQFSENFSDTIINTTTAAFNGPIERSAIDNLTKNDLDSKVTAFNAGFNPYWDIQKKNNFKIVTVPQEPSVIISVLNQGYPVTVSMTIINLDLDGAFGIPLVTQDGLNNVLQYTDKSQTQNNIPLSTHAVVAIGYTNKTTSGNYYIRIRNSWSNTFGDNGYFYMPMSFFINPEYCTGLYTIALSGIDVINIPGVITTPTTTTVYDWRNLKIGQTRVFTTNNGSLYKINDGILIFYSVKDSITGEITGINGNDITISITAFTSNAAYTTLYTLVVIPPDTAIAGSQTDIMFTLGGSLGVNSIITGGECYLYSGYEDGANHPVQINIGAGGRPVFSTDPESPIETQLYQVPPTERTAFTLVEGCFVEKTETPQIHAISITPGISIEWGFQSASFSNFAGVLTGYVLPYAVGVISIISS